jgi:eukaryotic-like serine/threonine-protein kinase
MKPERWKQIDQLFDLALQREASQRTAFLKKACAGDEELRREVESLLAHREGAECFIEVPALEDVAGELAESQPPPLVGQQIDAYKICSLLGVGGMGEVYRAKDTRLGREVAVKVLPSSFSADGGRLRRFEREARAAGRLNHPNVLAIYDVGTCDGSPYIVSELLEGATLRDQMGGNALTQRKSIDYALQIARGLAAAHEKGIIHRDLKPENVFITKDGRVKILDFGLAKLTHPAMDSGDLMETSTATGTAPGVLMGTAGYMSPEQVRAQVVDHRSDIFSLGAVLYEMVSGQRAFQGKSVVEMMNAILKEEPPELPPNRRLAPALERIVRHCLEKSPEQRFQSASDIAFNLEALSDSTPSTFPVLLRRSKRERLAWVVAAVATLTALVLAIAYFRRAPIGAPVLKLSVLPPENATFGSASAISPDGRHLAFVATANGKTLLWVRRLDSLTAQALPGTEGADDPFWSPDGRFIAFFAQGKLKKVEISGGPPQPLCDATDDRGGTWNRDGVIIFAPNLQGELYRISVAGGAAAPLTTLDYASQENSHRWPHFLPDGQHFVYFVRSAQRDKQGFYVGSLDSTKKERLLNGSGSIAYVAPGYLLFVRNGTLMAHRFDVNSLQITGEPISLAEQVACKYRTYSEFSVSDAGVLTYRRDSGLAHELIWFDRGGKQIASVASPADFNTTRLSPDEKRVAGVRFDPYSGAGDIWLLEPHGITSRFTFDPGYEWLPVWSPDGSRIVFSSNRNGPMDLYLRELSSSAPERLLLESRTQKLPTDWSRDGRFILYEDFQPNTNKPDLWVLPMSGDRHPMPFLQTPFEERQGQFSPDGRWIAYVSDESGRYEVYVQSFPAAGAKRQISATGGTEPRWRRDGKELFYLGANGKLMAVQVKGDSGFEASVPKALFATPPLEPGGRLLSNYSVTADGERFLINSFPEQVMSTPITVVINWTAELRKKLN